MTSPVPSPAAPAPDAPSPGVPAPAGTPVSHRVAYWSLVAGQLRKNRSAMMAWRLLKGLWVLAVMAPFLAMNVPLFRVGDGQFGWTLHEHLFDRTVFANGVDVFFNMILVAAPFWILGRRVATDGRAGRPSPGTIVWAIVVGVSVWAALVARPSLRLATFGVGGAFGVLSFASFAGARPGAWLAAKPARALAVLAFVVGFFAILDRNETRPWTQWRGEGAVASTFAFFPPVPFHPDNVGDDPRAPLVRARYNAPSGSHWLGCDDGGRDVISRLLFGTRISLTIGLVGVSIYILIGVILGALAGYYGGWVDLLISRLLEIMICFPVMFLLLTIIAVFDTRSIFLIMFAIGLVGWPGVARLVRGEFLRQRGLDYVTAATSQGIPERRVIFGHVLPNCLGPVLVSATFGVASAILTESGIAFLGLGDPNASSWGELLTKGRSSGQWHLILAPGLAIFFVVTVFNLLGEGLRDALDPKLRR